MTSTVTQNLNHRPFNPTTKALQFRAWQIAQREGGNVTREQIATEMGECPRRIGRVLRDEKWADTLRVTAMDLTDRPRHEAGFAHEASEIAGRLGAILNVEMAD